MEGTDAEFSNVVYHSNVRWLSVNKVLKKFYNLKTEIISFAEEKRKESKFSNLYHEHFGENLAFARDIADHLSNLNAKLQGKNSFAHDMFFHVKAFMNKLQQFSQQLQENIHDNFQTLQSPQRPSVRFFTKVPRF